MQFLVDADMPRSSAAVLRSLGHEQRIIVTADPDFADVRTCPPGTHAGIIVLRLPDHFKATEIKCVVEIAIPKLEQADVGQALAIIEASTIRIRRAAR